jgi:predicted extracellular nuclease
MTPRHPRQTTLLRALLRSLPLAIAGCFLAPAHAAVVISQVYGGGGNTGATLQHDFIELFNNGTTAENIGGWSVQYAAATGTSWQFTAIPAGTTLQPGRYYLVRQAAGAGGTVPVVGDLTGTIAMGAASGKVALANIATALAAVAAPTANVVDIVSYGASTPTEGSPTAVLSALLAAVRNASGCTDTNNNGTDFTVTAPAPRNLASAAFSCSGTPAPPPPPPPPPPTAQDLAIFQIQGSGATSTVVGQLVRTDGIVTKVLNNGFFIQDAVGDGNPATSDGIFVFTSTAPPATAVVGNRLQVTGTVVEFSSGAGTAATPLTEISNPTLIDLIGTGTITPVTVTLPLAAGDSLERFEGMLVRIDGTLTVQQNYFQSRYGQVTIGAGRHETPTNRFRPNSTEAIALADLQARSRLLLDDGSSLQNPNPTPFFFANGLPRAGDTVSNLVGVIDFGLATSTSSGAGLYRLQPTSTPAFATGNPRPATPAAVGGNVKLGSMNVLNFFTTFTNGATADGQTGQGCSLGGSVSAGNCRGADSLNEFTRQRSKIVRALAGLNADAVGLMEIQNNGNVAAQNLVDALNAFVGAGTYAVVPVPPQGTGTDAIRVAMIYKPASLSLVGASVSDPAAVNNRPTLAQTFTAANGEKFVLVVNHLKSKGSCPASGVGDVDSGDGQGCWNATRVLQAQQLRTFVAQLQSNSGTNDVMLVGDFNAYGREDPIVELTSNGYIDQAGRYNAFAYSYVFDGAAGRLDHAISTATMSPKIVGTQHWHVNADEQLAYDYNVEFKAPETTCGGLCPPDPINVNDAYRSSDHDPVLVGLDLYKLVPASTGRELLTGSTGADRFVFTSVLQGGSSISGFQPGIDQVVLSDLLRSLGRSAVADPIGSGVVGCSSSRLGAVINIDTDGSAGPLAPRALVQLNGLTCLAALQPQNFVFR